MIGEVVPLGVIICAGFGQSAVTADGHVVLTGDPRPSHYELRGAWHRNQCKVDARSRRVAGLGYLTLARIERYLTHRTRSGAPLGGVIEAIVYAPLGGFTVRRESPGRWVVVDENRGFA